MISPLRVTDADPVALRADFKDSYRAAIAAAYSATGNLSRAQARLSLLQDSNTVEALNAQAQRMLANGDSNQQTDQVAALALALEKGITSTSGSAPATEVAGIPEATATFAIRPSEVPIELTATGAVIDTQSPADETQPAPVPSTPRPTRTPVPTLGAPFALTGQENICDSNLPDGLLQIIVLNFNRRQIAGAKILITWDGGEEQFFTGLKPELGDGYADYVMTPNTTYTVQLALGSDIAANLVTPTCQSSSGETFSGGIKLTFQQP
jgi:hypothetical protein